MIAPHTCLHPWVREPWRCRDASYSYYPSGIAAPPEPESAITSVTPGSSSVVSLATAASSSAYDTTLLEGRRVTEPKPNKERKTPRRRGLGTSCWRQTRCISAYAFER